MTDSQSSLLKLSFNTGQIRGSIVHIEEPLQAMLAPHNYSPKVSALLGEFAAAITLLRSMMKFEGQLSLQARGNGHLHLINIEANDNLEFRGIAQTEGASDATQFADLLGTGQMAMTTMPTTGQSYQGIIPLSHANVNECIEDYFDRSEQVPTRIWLACDGERCAGLSLQKLPSSKEDDPDEWGRLTQLGNTLKSDELLDTDNETLLNRLFHEEEVRIHSTQSPTFKCLCSRERLHTSLTTLGEDQLEQIFEEDGVLTVECEFCKTEYTFSPSDFSA